MEFIRSYSFALLIEFICSDIDVKIGILKKRSERQRVQIKFRNCEVLVLQNCNQNVFKILSGNQNFRRGDRYMLTFPRFATVASFGTEYFPLR